MISSPQAMMPEWQDISTAPKDGTVVLLSNGNEVLAACWCVGEHTEKFPWTFLDYLNPHQAKTNGWTESAPTHWMPLPPPPVPTPMNEEAL